VLPVLIHNQCSNFELVSPVYFGHNTICLKFPSQKVDANTATRASFGQNITKSKFVGVLIYKLQRKGSLKSDVDNISKEGSPTDIQLLVIWEPKSWRGLFLRVLLIEHNNTITWNEDKLSELYSMQHALLNKRHCTKTYLFKKCTFTEDAWLLDDATMLMTRSKWTEEGDIFEIIISEETRKYDYAEPLWIPLNM
jgi:hypothetical protein